MLLTFFLSFRFHDVPVGVFVETITKLRLLSAVHQMVEPGKGRIQIGRLQSGVEALGRTQEQTGHELRNDGTSSQVLYFSVFIPFHQTSHVPSTGQTYNNNEHFESQRERKCGFRKPRGITVRGKIILIFNRQFATQ